MTRARFIGALSTLALVHLCACHLVFPHSPSSGEGVRPLDRATNDGPRLTDRDHTGERGADLASCPPQCSSCSNGTCFLKGCGPACVCPAGMGCDIDCVTGCSGEIDCREASACTIACGAACSRVRCGTGPCIVQCTSGCPKVDCSASAACTVNCLALLAPACTEEIRCGPGTCNVTCDGNAGPACAGKVDCAQASSCNVYCVGSACSGGVACGKGSCDVRCSKGAKGDVTCAEATPCCVSNLAGSACSATCPAGCPTTAPSPCWCTGCK